MPVKESTCQKEEEQAGKWSVTQICLFDSEILFRAKFLSINFPSRYRQDFDPSSDEQDRASCSPSSPGTYYVGRKASQSCDQHPSGENINLALELEGVQEVLSFAVTRSLFLTSVFDEASSFAVTRSLFLTSIFDKASSFGPPQ
ncbi:hypothetical protein STEG23_003474 [Scotinomys teguina]